jgi:glyoxylase-like metal-dependent hydrolase (beta-lactamase superfamily II)
MLNKTPAPQFELPYPQPPEPGTPLEVAPGLLWLRLPLPFQLNHVNVYLIEDDGGWTLLDTGLGNTTTREVWERVLSGPLAGQTLTRMIVTHHHPDHVGLAGWFSQRFGLQLDMSQTDYLMSLNLHLDPAALEAQPFREFYLRHGLDAEATTRVVTQGHNYLRMLTGLPPTFRRLIAGEKLRIGAREFEVLSGGGHAPEQLMLLCRAEKLFLSADQVLARISPNVSVWAVDPEGDPLAIYLRSLAALRADVPDDALVLPGHDVPFYGLHRRVGELERHHERRCAAIAAACRDAPRSAAELVPALFRRPLGPHELSFAFSEVLAHVNLMLRRDMLTCAEGPDSIKRFAVTSAMDRESPAAIR